MSVSITRGQLLSRSARGGAALIVAGSALGHFVDTARAEPLADLDLAYARLLVATELLASDFYTKALDAKKGGRKVQKYLKRAYANEQEHYQSVAAILSGAGQTPATTVDIDYAYPAGTFKNEGSIVKLGLELETIMLGAYLGALDGMQSGPLKAGIGRIAASEAVHAGYLSLLKGRNAFLSFPPALTIQQASDAMDRFIA